MPSIAPLSRDPSSDRNLSVVEHACEQLAAAISAGRYATGQHLSEARLTLELGISRGSLREALRRMAADGLLDIIPNRGAIVRRFTQEEVSEFFQIRALYEGLAARRSAERIEEPGHRRIAAALLQEVDTVSASGDPVVFATHNNHLHETIMILSGGDLLRREWERLRNGRQRLRHLQSMTIDYRRHSLDDHRALMTAILDGDGARAQELGAAHVDIAKKQLLRMPLSEFDTMVNGAV